MHLLLWLFLTNFNLCILCTSSNERINIGETDGGLKCQRVQFQSTPMLETAQTRRFSGLQKLWGGMRQLCAISNNVLLSHKLLV